MYWEQTVHCKNYTLNLVFLRILTGSLNNYLMGKFCQNTFHIWMSITDLDSVWKNNSEHLPKITEFGL